MGPSPGAKKEVSTRSLILVGVDLVAIPFLRRLVI